MHSFLIATAFLLMVISPCIFAQFTDLLPVRVRWVRPRYGRRPNDPLLQYVRHIRRAKRQTPTHE